MKALLWLLFCSQIHRIIGGGDSAAVKKKSRLEILSRWYFDRLVIFPSHKTIFCLIEKNANTVFSSIFQTIPNDMVNPNFTSGMWRQHCPKRNRLTPIEVSSFIKDPTWFKAVFYRDPLERFLSAYRSKCGGVDADGPVWCRREFGRRNASFEEVLLFYSEGNEVYDPHFERQDSFCGGIGRFLGHFNIVKPLNPQTLRDDFSPILTSLNISLTNLSSPTVQRFYQLIPAPSNATASRIVPVEDIMSQRRYTNSSEVTMLQRYYRKQCYVRTVVDLYKKDYQRFHIPFPAWALPAIQNTSRRFCKGLPY